MSYAAWIPVIAATIVSGVGAVVSVLNARKAQRHAFALSKEEHDRALEATNHATQAQLNAARELEFFKLTAPNVGPAHAALVAWFNANARVESAVRRGVATVPAAQLSELGKQASQAQEHAQNAGVMLPPILDDPYQVALTELLKASGPHVSADTAKRTIKAFAEAARLWKQSEWQRMTGAVLPPRPPDDPSEPDGGAGPAEDDPAEENAAAPKKGANGFCAPAGNNSLEQCAKHLAWEVRALPQGVLNHWRLFDMQEKESGGAKERT